MPYNINMATRKQISMKRLYMLAVGYCKTKEDMKKIADYLKYVFVHKNDEL